MKSKKVSLVGAGCGDPEFLTLKALKRLQGCSVLIYDNLVSERILAQAPADCEKIYVGKRYGQHAMKQEEINALLIQKAREGKAVVRLKGGDPYVFGRGGEEFLALLEAGIECEEIPGITSSVAVPAAAGIPVTHRGLSRSFTVITGTTAQGEGQEGLQMDFEALARLGGTLVILMGMHHLGEIAAGLIQAGKAPDTPCAVIIEGTTAGQRCVRAPLLEIAARAEQAKLKPPGVIVIGAVAQLELVSGEEQPLHGIAVGVTGTPHFVEKLSRILEEKGALVRDMGFMEIRENPASLPDLGQYGWLVFTSPNGVRIFLDKLRKERRDLRSIRDNRIAVIGPSTAQELEAAGIYADYMPQSYNAAHLAEGLTERILEETEGGGLSEGGSGRAAKPALFLRAAKGSEALPQTFKKRALSFEEFPLYEIGVEEKRRALVMGESPDYLVFGAGSGVRAYFEAYGRSTAAFDTPAPEASAAGRPRFVCMGEACGRELARFVREEFLMAQESSAEGIAERICGDVKGKPSSMRPE